MERKKQICDVARKLFIKKGFENTTMKDIMEETGISIGGLYYHYENIYDVLKDVIMSAEDKKNEMFFEIKEQNMDIDIESILINSCIEFLFDSSEYSTLYVHLLIGMKDEESLRELYHVRKEKAKREFLNLLKKIKAEEYYFFSNDDFIDFFNFIKIGNYYLKDVYSLEARKKLYVEFIKSYISSNKS